MFQIPFLLLACVEITSACDFKPRDQSVENDICDSNMSDALQFLDTTDKLYAQWANRVSNVIWSYMTNLTEANLQAMLNGELEYANHIKESWEQATSFHWSCFKDINTTAYRWFKEVSVLGNAALPPEKIKKHHELIAEMGQIYATAKICDFENSSDCSLSLEPEITKIVTYSRNNDELKHVWSAWRDASGKKMRKNFTQYVELSNEAACLNGFSDYGEFWRNGYDSDTFQEDIEALWVSVRPLYQQLHAYTRKKLIQFYGGTGIRSDGPIPAHLLGNMWAQTFENIFDLLSPYPNKTTMDITEAMRNKNMTPLSMFKLSEEFYVSLGLMKMTPEFWNKSIIEKPKDRDIICHPAAFTFHDDKSFRIKMCTVVDKENLIIIHHEMGHIEYYMQYAGQPFIFQNGANSGFHEAIGDTLALSVSTTTHWQKIGLLPEDTIEDEEADINTLLHDALQKIAFLPFGYVVDSWRYEVFRGDIPPEEYNLKWWEHRLKYQGLCPPVQRSEDDFDPGALYHVGADYPYIGYFVSFVIQFQFHKALCEAAGYEGPLHKCDIYGNKEAGRLLGDMLKLGNSVPWGEAMKVITKGKTDKMDAGPLQEYFEPLRKWLEKENEGEVIGWTSDNPAICP